MKRVLVIGAAGFIGSATARALEGDGFEVLAVDNDMERLGQLKCRHKQWCDIRDLDILSIIKRFEPDTVIHLAAQSSVARSRMDWEEDAEINILGTINVVKACQRYGVSRLVYSSSGGEIYGEPSQVPTPETHYLSPQSPYGVSKLAAEFYVKMSGISHSILRYANVYGPGQPSDGESGVVAIFIGKALEKRPFPIFNSEHHVRDFVFISDVVNANIIAALNPNSGVFNIGTGRGITVDEVASEICFILGYDSEREFHGARIGEIETVCLDSKKAKQVLGWEPMVPFKTGLHTSVKSMQGGYWLPSPATTEVSHAI